MRVCEVFGPTVQGEGPHAGQPAVFVRLGGCNLDCVWCDTRYSWDWEHYDPTVEVHQEGSAALAQRVIDLARDRVELCVLTGGEPLLQQRRWLLFLAALSAEGIYVDVETNGTIGHDTTLEHFVRTWVVSPKLANSGITYDRRIKPEVLRGFEESGCAVLKFVVRDPSELDEVAAVADLVPDMPVYVMPEGTSAVEVLGRTGALAADVIDRGWNLTTRLHVLLWGDVRGR